MCAALANGVRSGAKAKGSRRAPKAVAQRRERKRTPVSARCRKAFAPITLVESFRPIHENIYLLMHQLASIDEFVEVYVSAIKYRLRSHEQIRRHLRRFVHHFPGRSIDSIRKRDIAEYAELRQRQGVSPASINIELATYSAAINYARRRWEFEIPNPVSGMYFPSAPGRLRFLEKHEATTLLQEARKFRSSHLAHLIELALNTGARKNELLQLQFRSIDLRRRILTIEAHTTKTGKRRYLPMNDASEEVLRQRDLFRQTNCPFSPWVFCTRKGTRLSYPDNSFRLAVQRSGLSDFCFHDLRHTFASWLVSEGVELIKVRDLLGHTSIRMTERYAHLAPFRLHEAVGALDGLYEQSCLDLGVCA